MGAAKIKVQTKSPLELALDYTFANEGGFSNDKNDRGGATRWGITRSEAARWRKKPVSVAEMKVFPIEEAMQIYEAWYWNPLSLSQVTHLGEAIAMFDIGVVMGIGIPPRFAQEICNEHGSKLERDGHIGPLTLAEINKMVQAVFVRDFSVKTEARFRGIVRANSSQQVFLKGWVNRAHRLLTLMNYGDVISMKSFMATQMIAPEPLVRFAYLEEGIIVA